MKTLIKLWIGFWLIVGLSSCAGRSTWCGSGSRAKHCSTQYRHALYELVYEPEPLNYIQAQNLLRAAVYANQNGW